VISIPPIADIYNKAKKNNLTSGIIIFDIISFISYVINPFSFVYPGDLDILFGGILALIFTLKNKKTDQIFLKLGITVGLAGAFFSAISISVYDLIFAIFIYGYGLAFLFIRVIIFSIIALMIGLILGIIFGYIYDARTPKEKTNSKKLDEFLDELI
jgi:hypothetical protein